MPSFPPFKRSASDQLPNLSPEAYRLFWTLQGPFTSAITVMPKDWRTKGSEPRELYYIQEGSTPADDSDDAVTIDTTTTILHPIAYAPLTEPKIGSITVSVYPLDMWEQQWLESHEDHADPDNEHCGECVFGRLPADYEGDEGDPDSEEELLRCCDTDRPTGKWRLTVQPADTEAGFVTVHDYLSAVHPWLMSLRGQIVQADNVWDSHPPEYYDKIMVEHVGPDLLMIADEQCYVGGERSGGPYHQQRQMGAAQAQGQEQIPASVHTSMYYTPEAQAFFGSAYRGTWLEQLVARAETSGDLEAAERAIFQSRIQQTPHGLSQGTVQALRDSRDRDLVEDYEKQVRALVDMCKASSPEASPEEIEEYVEETMKGARASLARWREDLKNIG
ncbi:hypothetical protein PG993_003639 [Apiospora rasikravindrae]|uniref:Uncharacterized protein n=1 Tax=Apiospora rasikravindrae TaxID=990691 RepID=A0ABR1U044_9PEZI